MKQKFSATIKKVGINPCIDVPQKISKSLGIKGFVPVKGEINGKNFTQTLVPLGNGRHRLFVNIYMRKAANVNVGDKIRVKLEIDKSLRTIPIPIELKKAFSKNSSLKNEFDKLPPSRKKEILVYLNSLKTKESIERNIKKLAFKLSAN